MEQVALLSGQAAHTMRGRFRNKAYGLAAQQRSSDIYFKQDGAWPLAAALNCFHAQGDLDTYCQELNQADQSWPRSWGRGQFSLKAMGLVLQNLAQSIF